MNQFENRRAFIARLAKGVTAALVVACTPSPTTPQPTTGGTTAVPAPGTGPPSTNPAAPSSTAPVVTTASTEGYRWSRTDLGFVSAYVLVRAGEAVIVDTGVAGSVDAIETTLTGLGAGWGDVSSVIITHEHGDHAGSAQAVLDRATAAIGYAAEPDIRNIESPRPLTAVSGGDTVAGLEIIATPGHTPGHIAVLDPGRILVTGDAINNVDGTLTGPNPQFSSDMDTALASVGVLAGFDYEVALFGHGVPIESGASLRVSDLAASL
ncbi:MAG: MBL fold metallo-hydrolase [Acidimicrobiia bacterium]|nr:MBL fold metallo-hydrolase [Acidimicrobiia bacterium]MDH4306253.1 MBL fold metallo-hydrolase [Acidimicrobiia bacterium]MDH5292409.1 MBL fold metallo-hydrolase [Acidimicrobiia bacterium]